MDGMPEEQAIGLGNRGGELLRSAKSLILTSEGVTELSHYLDFWMSYYTALEATIRRIAGERRELTSCILDGMAIILPLLNNDEREAIGSEYAAESEQLRHILRKARSAYKRIPMCETLDTLKSMPYQEYLQTTHWKRTSRRAKESAGNRCQLCNSDQHLDVHHRTYEHRGEEEPGDLIVLCRDCHTKHHDKLPEPPGPEAKGRRDARDRD